MNKKENATIKETIEDLLELRRNLYDDYMDSLSEMEWIGGLTGVPVNHKPKKIKIPFSDDVDKDNPFVDDEILVKRDEKDIWEEFIYNFDKPLVQLNNLLNSEEQYDEVKEIEKNMVKLNNKKYLTVKEFSEKYNISKTSQQNYRGRLYDPLPFQQKIQNGKITYLVEEVEKWFENQYKSGKL